MKYAFYKTTKKERWDTIAHLYYGNSYKIKPIIEANPHIKVRSYIKEGSVVKIPIEEKTTADTSGLPIWKRTAAESGAG